MNIHVTIILVNGRRLIISPESLLSWITSAQFVTFLSAIWGIAIVLDPVVASDYLSLLTKAAFWLVVLLIYLGIMLALGVLVAVFANKIKLEAVYWPIVGVPVVVVATLIIGFLGSFIGRENIELEITSLSRSYFLAQVFEFLLLNFVLSDHLWRQRLSKLKSSSGTVQTASLVANGRTIFVDQILMLEAKQHYVEITTRTGKIVVRSTLKTLLAQIPEAAGLQVHRSYWVSRNFMTQLSGNVGKKAIHLKNGGTVPVSRPREESVNRWFLDQTGTVK